ncbi:hypothetical protein ACFQVC_22665 [Streptomyces monticola]|uniref:Carboxypeptidase regulatory-like domain-containing protein n=1 Tax=Streptomyces monticola TaxID=2666263 RepID=A0ABW2JLL2_9ACTN
MHRKNPAAPRALSRVLLAAALGLAVSATVAPPAHAADMSFEPGPVDSPHYWGKIIEGEDAQAHAWLVRSSQLPGAADTTLVQAHSHDKKLPRTVNTGAAPADLRAGQFPLGRATEGIAVAVDGKLPPKKPGGDLVDAKGAVFAGVTAKSLDIGLPYWTGGQGTPALSPIGLHLENVSTTATAAPGKPVAFKRNPVKGYLSLLGQKMIEVPKDFPVGELPNFGGIISPKKGTTPAISLVLNEQVSTDAKGQPTLGKDGKYAFDEQASSGYTNAFHFTLLGTNAADLTVGHAAALSSAPVTAPGKTGAAGRTGAAGKDGRPAKGTRS